MTDVQIINLPKVLDERGNLSFFENDNQLPFEIKRAYWIYDVPGGEVRGSHAFKDSHELIIALSGSFDVVLNDGIEEKKYSLNRSYYGLYVPNMLWRRLENFSTNSLALIVSNISYDEADYIRDFNEFISIKNGS
jgi:dTDP-4-dehydrorhamnose 3,5-epimerase-like enzyme